MTTKNGRNPLNPYLLMLVYGDPRAIYIDDLRAIWG